MFRPHTAILSCYRILSSRSCCSVMPLLVLNLQSLDCEHSDMPCEAEVGGIEITAVHCAQSVRKHDSDRMPFVFQKTVTAARPRTANKDNAST
jgi:hypothetical protein